MPWYHTLGWRGNPFDYRPSADFFVFKQLADELIKYIQSGSVVSAYGIAGMGKTSLLHYLSAELSRERHVCIFVDLREISSKNDFVTLLNRRLSAEAGIFGKLKEIVSGDKRSIVEKMHSALGKKQLVLMIDEAGLLKDDGIASLLATIKDNINSSIVSTSINPLSSYSIYKDSFREGRVAREIAFPIPLKEDLTNMVKERIEHCGGKGTYPFSDETLDYIAKLSGNIPREVLINCQNAAIYYVDEKLNREISKSDLEIFLTGKTISEHKDEDIKRVYKNLSENQRKIIQSLVVPKSAKQLADELNISYGSITKEIGRLMLQTDTEMMFRKGLRNPVCTRTLNRPYKYVLTKKWRLLFAKE